MNSIAAYAVAVAWTANRFQPSDAEPSAPQHSRPAPTGTPLAGGDFARSELRFVRASRRWDALIRRLVEPTA
jgi:hypothetical protein